MEVQQNEDGINAIVECKKVIFQRSVKSALISLVSQVELVLFFAVVINIALTEPLSSTWSVRLFFSYFGTWFSLILLLLGTICYIILLEKNNVKPKTYYPTRAHWLVAEFLPKSVLLLVHVNLGCLTVVHLSSYLHQDYRTFTFKCYDIRCLNDYYIQLLGSAIFASCYYFFTQNAKEDPVLEIPIIQERKLVQMRSLLTFNIKRFVRIAIAPYVYYMILFILFGGYIKRLIAEKLGVGMDGATNSNLHLLTNIQLQFYTFLVMLTILGNMYLMKKFSSIFLTEDFDFDIDSSRTSDAFNGIALADALNITELPIIQTLAAWNLYNLCSSKSSSKRKAIFSLSLPGGHPYAWNTISEVSLKIIRNYTNDLIEATAKSQTLKKNWYQKDGLHHLDDIREQKLNLRHFNKSRGIRLLSDLNEEIPHPAASDEEVKQSSQDPLKENSVKLYEQITKHWDNFVSNIPGLNFWFGEDESAQINFVLANSQTVIWLIQAITGICAVSKIEDTYGVVQNTLPDIISAILKLKSELEKLENLNLNGIKIDSHSLLLLQAVKRSLYKICVAFGNYMNDIVTNPAELKQLQNFLNFEEF